jgi:hypothetical protein
MRTTRQDRRARGSEQRNDAAVDTAEVRADQATDHQQAEQQRRQQTAAGQAGEQFHADALTREEGLE